jgi:hypothetical protein
MRERKTRARTENALVEVRFDLTVDPTPYENRKSTRSLLGAVADGKVVVSLVVNGVESSTVMRFPALRKIESKLPEVIMSKILSTLQGSYASDYKKPSWIYAGKVQAKSIVIQESSTSNQFVTRRLVAHGNGLDQPSVTPRS